jgi:hypothetical protein
VEPSTEDKPTATPSSLIAMAVVWMPPGNGSSTLALNRGGAANAAHVPMASTELWTIKSLELLFPNMTNRLPCASGCA